MTRSDVEAVTFDFFNTLVRHPHGDGGRGARLMDYLRTQGLACDPWEHQVLYDVLEPHAREYSPALPPAAKEQYLIRLAERVFQRLNVRCETSAAAGHAAEIWKRIGPGSLEVYPDVGAVLGRLRTAGYRLAVVSNWQCGLGHFCEELGVAAHFDEVLASAEIGNAKPDPRIFQEACRRLRVGPDRVLHVGDTPEDDIAGAGRAGIRAVLICRGTAPLPSSGPSIRSLDELPALLGLDPGGPHVG